MMIKNPKPKQRHAAITPPMMAPMSEPLFLLSLFEESQVAGPATLVDAVPLVLTGVPFADLKKLVVGFTLQKIHALVVSFILLVAFQY